MSTGTNIPKDLMYTKEHEWIRRDGSKGRVGITDHAQHALGDIVFVELPAPGRTIRAGEAVGVVESVKAVSDIYSPVTGKVTVRNENVNPALVNSDPYGAGWLFEVEIESAGELLTPDAYSAHIG
ncbi:MAG: glycine cleavage system protein GcvH [Candidatus Hydrogenedentota bacterium]